LLLRSLASGSLAPQQLFLTCNLSLENKKQNKMVAMVGAKFNHGIVANQE
jgi:hypothetical protein